MKIGITGGTGFVGRAFVERYFREHDLTILTMKGEQPRRFGDEKYVCSDFSAEDIVRKFSGCDAVVHLAFARPPIGRPDSAENYYESISISDNVFSASKALDITNIVVMSSRSVYNASMPMPLKEDFTSPYSVYGEAKLEVEKLGASYNERGMKIKFLRSAQVMGIGERRNLMTVYLERSLKKETLNVYGEGASTKTYIYVKDAARAR